MKFIKAWRVDDDKVERAIHSLLDNERHIDNERHKGTDWFYDESDNLVQRLSGFMRAMDYEEYEFDKDDKSFDKQEHDLQELKEHVNLLVGETLSVDRRGVTFKVTVQKNVDDDDEVYYAHYLKKVVAKSLNNAFRQSFTQYGKDHDEDIDATVGVGINAWLSTKK